MAAQTGPRLLPEAFPELAEHDVLLFDGECRFCQAQAKRLASWARPPLRLAPLQTPGLLDALAISHETAMQAMQLITADGRRYRGAEAAVQALRGRPLLGTLAKLYYVPGLRQLCDLGYRIIARYRYAIMGRAIARGECDGGSCRIHLGQKT